MASTHKDDHFYKNTFHVLSPSKNRHNPVNQLPSLAPTNSDHVFPILAVAVLSIMGTACLLFCYYVVLNKCCSNRHEINLLRWFASRRTRGSLNSLVSLSPPMWNRGLEQSIIREIPTLRYKKRQGEEGGRIYGCVVCLNEFQEKDMLRVLPNCSHAFHLDCIDIWLQSNGNCPLCRTSISGTNRNLVDHINAPASSPQGSQQYTDSLMGGDEDFVVIELGGSGDEAGLLSRSREQERHNSRDVQVQLGGQSPILKIREHKVENQKLNPRKHHRVSIMGDECIDVRGRDDQFSIQPLRRSFSLDSAADQQIYLSVQAIIQRNGRRPSEIKTTEETSTRGQRSFLSFGHGRGLRKAVLPVEFEP